MRNAVGAVMLTSERVEDDARVRGLESSLFCTEKAEAYGVAKAGAAEEARARATMVLGPNMLM